MINKHGFRWFKKAIKSRKERQYRKNWIHMGNKMDRKDIRYG